MDGYAQTGDFGFPETEARFIFADVSDTAAKLQRQRDHTILRDHRVKRLCGHIFHPDSVLFSLESIIQFFCFREMVTVIVRSFQNGSFNAGILVNSINIIERSNA